LRKADSTSASKKNENTDTKKATKPRKTKSLENELS